MFRRAVFLLVFSQFFIINFSHAVEPKPRPNIWVKPSDRAAILNKIETQPWARSLFREMEQRLEFVLNAKGRGEVLKQLPLQSSENATQFPTLPFFRVKGGGTTQQSRQMIKTILDGVDCGVLYYLTENETYAQCATDVLFNLLQALKKMPLDKNLPEKGFRNKGWIYPTDHLYEARAVGAQLPIIYDLIAPYVRSGGLAYNLHTQNLEHFDTKFAQEVFKNYIWMAINNGPSESNWPVFESLSLVHNILALDSPYDIEKYLPFYTHIDLPRQTSLKTVASSFKKEGDIWPESFQYAIAVANFSVYLMTLLDRYDTSLKLASKYPNIAASFKSFYDLQYPNRQYPLLGDGHRAYPIYYHIHEMALLLAIMNNNEEQEEFYRNYLASSVADGVYKRDKLQRRYYGARPYMTPLQLLWQSDTIDGNLVIDLNRERPRVSQLSYAGVHIQRNTYFNQPVKNSLMAFVGGAPYIHGHASGMDMELYGQGHVLGIDGGRNRYTSEIHENYYRLFAAHNTVISNGASASWGGWIKLGIEPVNHEFTEPKLNQSAVSPNYSFSRSFFFDKHNLVAPAEHQRTLALIKINENRGYYLDVFRAKSAVEKQYHDYIYHNIGERLKVSSKGEALELNHQPERYKPATDGKWVFHRKYNHPGWSFFKNVQSSAPIEDELVMTFTAAKASDLPVAMRAVSPGGSLRDITTVMAPPSSGASLPYNKKRLPTFLMRKHGDAWRDPFVVVYESTSGDESFVIQSVQRLFTQNIFSGVKVSIDAEGQKITQHIIIQEREDDVYENHTDDIYFKGKFGIVSANHNSNQGDLYIGQGSEIRYGLHKLKARGSESAYKKF